MRLLFGLCEANRNAVQFKVHNSMTNEKTMLVNISGPIPGINLIVTSDFMNDIQAKDVNSHECSKETFFSENSLLDLS